MLVVQNLYQFKPEPPFAPGNEVAGFICEVGPGVQGLKVGDRVFASGDFGGFAEKYLAPAGTVTPIDDDMPFDEAASFMMVYGTSHHALKQRADLKAGETLLVLGASGGVGLAAVELGKAMGARMVRKKMTVSESYDVLISDEADKLLDDEIVTRNAIDTVEQSGIVFLDEIDKVCARSDARGGDVSREGVQRDLLPLIEGTTVSTKFGPVKTDHILFIASGAFHIAKPSDLLPELQGRLPIRVNLRALSEKDFVRILTETDNALTLQYTALMSTEDVTVTFTTEGIAALAKIAAEVNHSVENIGARRLYTVIERVFEDLSFTAPDRGGEKITIDAAYVGKHLGELASKSDLSRYVL